MLVELNHSMVLTHISQVTGSQGRLLAVPAWPPEIGARLARCALVSARSRRRALTPRQK